MDKLSVVGVCLILLTMNNSGAFGDDGEMKNAAESKSERLYRRCSKCESKKCPPSEAYPHMTAFDDSLFAAALQSDYVPLHDKGIYTVPNVKGGQSTEHNAFFWFSNYMDKCSKEQSYRTVDEHGKVSLQSLSSLHSLAEADWKSINPPKKLNHCGFRFWVSHSTGKGLTVFGGKCG